MSLSDELVAPTEAAAWGVHARHRAWIETFRRANGRAPRVLGIGNIANNAFRNSAALRELGVECDVLCYNYLHVMGCPSGNVPVLTLLP